MRETKAADRKDDINRIERTLGNHTLEQNNILLDNLLWNIINETVVYYNHTNDNSHKSRRTINREEYLKLLDKIHNIYKRIN